MLALIGRSLESEMPKFFIGQAFLDAINNRL